MTCRGPHLVLGGRGQIAQTGHYVYVANIGIVSDHVTKCAWPGMKEGKISRKNRLMLHEISVDLGSGRAPGFELDFEQLRTLPTVRFCSHPQRAPIFY